MDAQSGELNRNFSKKGLNVLHSSYCAVHSVLRFKKKSTMKCVINDHTIKKSVASGHPNEKFKRFNGGLVILKERSFGPEVKTNVSQTISLNNLSK